MNHATALFLQACLDNELDRVCSERVVQLLNRDAAARTLCESLMQVKESLARYQTDLRIQHSRADYWSRIEQAILASEHRAGCKTSNPTPPTFLS